MSEAPIQWPGRGLLLDIEGTTSAVAYVYDVMFPYARRALEAYLDANWEGVPMLSIKEQVARDSGAKGFEEWTADQDARACFTEEVLRLMGADAKTTGLKQLQGLIWEAGFQDGELRTHVYDDVPRALVTWQSAGREMRVYSSGSVHAQKLFFAHTEMGDLSTFLSGHYDTTTGPKRVADSYRTIAEDWGVGPSEILFLSDIPAELDAAREAGMATVLVVRPGNAPADPSNPPHPEITSFDQIELAT